MTNEINKRALVGLTAGLGAGALALLAQTKSASADTPFSVFAFPTTGSPTSRTMPDRLAETKNVKDFGALGNGTTDDTPAIQQAINACIDAGGGTVFFPTGIYKTTAPLVFNRNSASHIMVRLQGTVAGIDNTSGARLVASFPDYMIKMADGGTQCLSEIHNLTILNNYATAGGAILFENVNRGDISNCRISGFIGIKALSNTFGINVRTCNLSGPSLAPGSVGVLGGQVIVMNCNFNGWDNGVRLSGITASVCSNRFEVNNTGIVTGFDDTNSDHALNTGSIIANSFERNNTSGYFHHSGNLFISGNQATGLVGVDGVSNKAYGFRLESVTGSVFAGNGASGTFSRYGISIEGGNTNLLVASNMCYNSGSGGRWFTAGVGSTDNVAFLNNDFPLLLTFARLPASPVQGMVFDITDSSASTWGARVAGGGTNQVSVRFNGSVWTVVGI